MKYSEIHKELGIDEETFNFGEEIRESLKGKIQRNR